MSLLTQLATKIRLAQLEAQGKDEIPLTEEILDAYQPQVTDIIRKGDVNEKKSRNNSNFYRKLSKTKMKDNLSFIVVRDFIDPSLDKTYSM